MLSVERPELSANRVFWPGQICFLVLLAIGLPVLFFFWPWWTASMLVALSMLFYVLFTVYKLSLVYFSVSSTAQITVAPESIAELDEASLPIYSVLVPLYHESESVGGLVQALTEMDYPLDKMDVQLLLEEDDEETRGAVEGLTLPQGFRATVVPVSLPRTKPKACNIGLDLALGKYLVIYDAEDRPEPDQLKKAVIAFARTESEGRSGRGEVICLQSKLNFYNPRQNLMTKWFTAEYSAWFDLSLPGLCALGSFIPLGGTSNHFHTDKLRELMGWDAFNVTEDCDLGARIYRAGYASRMLDTTTWEEACSRLRFWIPQRTRWLKGYMQTHLVHMRKPLHLMRELGVRNFLHFNVLVGGVVVCFLLNPIYWVLAGFWFVTRSGTLMSLFPLPVFAMGAFCLFVGNFAFVYSSMLGCYRRNYFDLVKHALLSPLYWVLMSYAGWRALFQLFSNPFKWEKTQHGLHKDASAGGAATE
jgi:cellulose synthase/poly-beta-1,6-N-acetylglucosamine synthase-like glycosyltransferase